MRTEFGIICDNEKCVQCHGCEVACKSWRNVETGISLRTIKTVWTGEYPDVKCTYVSAACMHCAEPACAAACPEGAIVKRGEDGIVLVKEDLCTGCRLCYDACPFGVPRFREDGIMQKCDLCCSEIEFKSQTQICVSTCPTQALRFAEMTPEEKKLAEEKLSQVYNKSQF